MCEEALKFGLRGTLMERWQQVGPSAVNTKLPFGSINSLSE